MLLSIKRELSYCDIENIEFTPTNMASEKTYPLTIDYVPDEYQEKAERELKETPEYSSRCIEELKVMVRNTEDENLKDLDFEEDFLRQFLRQSKYDVLRSFKRLQSFVKFRKQNEIFFKNVEDMSKSPDYQYCTPLPWRCRDGCTITLFEYSKWSPKGITFEDVFRLCMIVNHQSLRHPLTQINGFKMIVDFKGSDFEHFKFVPPSALFSYYKAFVTCTPARNKEIHVVNESFVWRALWTLFKPIISEKLRKRLFLHSCPEDLLNYFPKHCLPAQYGGDLEDYYIEDWMKKANEQQGRSTLAGQPNTF